MIKILIIFIFKNQRFGGLQYEKILKVNLFESEKVLEDQF